MTAPSVPAPAGSATASFAARLPSGSRPGPGPHTVGEIAKDLGRSAGAVENALATLADRGQADRDPGHLDRPPVSTANTMTGTQVVILTDPAATSAAIARAVTAHARTA